MSVTVAPLLEEHAEPAARLVRERVALLRRQVPELSDSCGSPETLAARIARLADRGPGAVALEAGRLVGFIGAFPLRFGGRSSLLSPEWGNGVTPGLETGTARRVREALYADVAREWDARGVETHLVCLLAHDRDAVELYSWLGFGCVVCDGVRPLTRIADPRTSCVVRRATAGDATFALDLDRRLHAHMEASPIFLSHGQPEDSEWWEARIADPACAVWIAEGGAGPVGYLIQGPASDDACDLIVDPATSSITGAYVVPDARNGGAATALLLHAVEWARAQGYERLSVDFESANLEGSRFWLRHFRPVVVSLARTVRAHHDSL
jgi:GNAT superfamily N-acetyltransferase